MTKRSNLLLSTFCALLIPSMPSNAFIEQVVTAKGTSSAPVSLPGSSVLDVDRVSGDFNTPIDRVARARVSNSSYEVESSVDQFGNLGLAGFLHNDSGSIEASVNIVSNEFINLSGVTQQATANFVIDGGLFTLDASPGSSLSYDLNLAFNDVDVFNSAAKLEAISTPSGFLTDIFTSVGDDIGATFDGDFTATVPLSFQSVDLGLIQPGERFFLEYSLYIRGNSDSHATTIGFEFNDPLSVAFTENFPRDIIFSDPASSPVPVPPSFLFMLSGLGFLRFITLNHN